MASHSSGPKHRRRRVRGAVRPGRILTSLGVAVVLAVGAPLTTLHPDAARAATAGCAQMTSPVLDSTDSAGAQVLAIATHPGGKHGEHGKQSGAKALFKASKHGAAGLLAVIRLAKPQTHDVLYTTSSGEAAQAVAGAGYLRRGVAFYVSADPGSCSVPVYRYRRNGMHRYVLGAGRPGLEQAGWQSEGVGWYAARAGTQGGGGLPAPKPTAGKPLTQPLYSQSTNRNDIAAYRRAPAGSTNRLLLWQLANTQIALWLGGSGSDAATVHQLVTVAAADHRTPTSSCMRFRIAIAPGRTRRAVCPVTPRTSRGCARSATRSPTNRPS